MCGLGVDEAKAFAVFRPSWLEGLSKVCLCSGLFCFYGMLLGVWGNTGLLFYRSPLCIGRTYLVGCCLWGGVLCENCIVDANAIKIMMTIMIVVVCFFFFVVLFLVFFVVCA